MLPVSSSTVEDGVVVVVVSVVDGGIVGAVDGGVVIYCRSVVVVGTVVDGVVVVDT